MTNVRRPIHLQLKPASLATCSPPKALSPTGDSLPSQIMPHLFVGNQEQTNRETINRLNISYVLSLGLLPLISNSVSNSPNSPTTTTTTTTTTSLGGALLMPTQNSSLDFKIRLRTNQEIRDNRSLCRTSANTDENKAIKAVRSIQCKCINISDNSDQSLAKFFDEAHQFIDEARRRKCNILVHCLAGVSRSPTIAIAYLMRVNSLRLQDAYNLVKQRRPQIDPNLSFMGQLMIYEQTLLPPRRSAINRDRANIEAQKQKL